MPNPLSKVRPKCNYEHSPDSLRSRPGHASLIMQVIANVSLIENTRGLIFSYLLGVDDYLALLIYSEIRSASVKSSAFHAVIKASLSEEDREMLNKIDKFSKKVIAQRNKFSHGLWGTSNDLPDAILYLPSDHFLDKTHQYLDNPHARGLERKILAPGLQDRSRVMVYTVGDLENSVSESISALSLYRNFFDLVFHMHHVRNEDAAGLLKEVFAQREAEIREQLRSDLQKQ